ncbi:RNA polymerase sigma factor SigB [Pseudobacillus badius]|uniref:RNA polymerase sigma factor SigB n=1 Tax=Bacillus badius TaxID=1455 RepID=UPI0007B0BFAA|nr:RNA polymerase sigma factor SigB [Bacillus badius]KZO00423.1 RNA polymerase sigma-B factor [Bacillus badius]MED0666249.1 RNA polymerase sigma factor SigB [Bacillus badius]OCS86649.1 RNA polymerase sigma factor SigB [Bacillus badius]OVE51663.1 RNA polymerase sigma factor SigB [Bacillus badius]TDW02908.1 RNA polymerase sigma-37 (RpsB/SigB) subunit [Bacillus badius]
MPKPSQPNQDTKQQVVEWIKAYQTDNDQEAQENLVKHYQGLVESIARKYSKGKSYHEDIAQVGMMGLLGAIRRYDDSYGKSFEAFAIPTIVGEIKRFLRDKTWSVHVPRRIKELGPKIKSTVEELTSSLQRSPKVEEIASHLDISEEEVLEAMEMGKSYQALSVDHSIEADSDGSTVTLLDIVGSKEQGYERVDQRLVLEKVLHVLSDRERQIIQYTYLENMSQKDAGDKLNISQMHVSRLQRRAIKKLKEAIDAESMTSGRLI